MSVGVVAVAHWRVDPDHREAVACVLTAGTRHVQLDVGGPGRGPVLDDTVLAELRRLGVVVDALAVNRANDLGLHRDGRPAPECLDLLLATVGLARRHGIPAVHVPSFRASAIVDVPSHAATAEVLARCADEGGPDLLVLTESTLGAADAVALVSATGASTVRVVADTGNLLDAGLDPVAFVETCRAHGVLAPSVHVKVPADVRAGEVAARTRAILAQVGDGDVLLENDYRGRLDLLAADVVAAYDRDAAHRRVLATPTFDPPTLQRTRPTEGAPR